MRVLLRRFGGRLAGQDLLGGLLLALVVVGVADQPVTHPVQHVDDVAERGVHLAHGVVGGGLRGTTPAGTGDVLARCPHLAGLVLNGLRVHVETARHRPHLVRVSHKTCRHISLLIVGVLRVITLWGKGINRRQGNVAAPWRRPWNPWRSYRVRPAHPSAPARTGWWAGRWSCSVRRRCWWASTGQRGSCPGRHRCASRAAPTARPR